MEYPRPTLGLEIEPVDDEALRKAFEKPTHPGMAVCRFCKDPLDLSGDFCEQCGAPIAEAMPPGTVRPERAPVSPVAPPPEPAPPSPGEARPVAAAVGPLVAPAQYLAEPAFPSLDPHPIPTPSNPPTPPRTTAQPPSGLLTRLKGVFTRDTPKKG